MPNPVAEALGAPDWYKALTLSERVALRRMRGAPGADAAAGGDPAGRERAARILERWRAQSPFSGDGFFARRLAADGVDEAGLLALLAEPAESLAAAAGETPEWLADLRSAYGASRPAAFPLEEVVGEGRYGRLLEVVRPLLDQAWERLVSSLEEQAAAAPIFSPRQVARMLATGLVPHLMFLLGRTLTVELQAAAQGEDGDGDGGLAGATPEERFASFGDRLGDPAAALALLRRYPVLARQASETVARWVANGGEVIRHLTADAASLRETFSPTAPLGTLVEIRTGLGDSHRGARTVTMLRFEGGLGLVYKPRSMAVDAAFQDLLDWTAARGFTPAFRRLRVLDAGDHGWAELVATAPCTDSAAVERFYLRQGGYLALLYALSGTDMHHENLIAAGEHPFLVDLEALFHPLDQAWGATVKGTPLPDTVLRVGFLPSGSWGAVDGKGGADLSGLAAAPGQVPMQPVLRLEDSGTDRMRYLLKPFEVPVGDHRPTLGGAGVDLAAYAPAIEAGFDRMLRLLDAHRDELLTDGGPLGAFASVQVRVLLRLTMAYAGVLVDGQHPFVLGDALDRDRLIDRLWIVASELPALARVVPAEHRDLVRGDVPLLTTQPGGRDVCGSDGEVISGLLDHAALEQVAARLRALDDGEIARQRWLVRTALDGAVGSRGEVLDYELPAAPVGVGAAEFLALAHEAGCWLDALAFRHGEGAIWFGPNIQAGTPRWVVAPVGPDLHLGTAGIALFLAHLGAVSGDTRMTELARAATVILHEQTAPAAQHLGSTVGAFAGWGGIIYALTHLGVLWRDESLLDAACSAAEIAAPYIAADTLCDLVGGAAGCLVCLLGLLRVRPSGRILDLARRCGERLLERAVPAAGGLGWVLDIAGPRPLAGFSHGAAGISWALLQLAAASGDERFRQAARGALAYERALYSPARRNWPDLRASAGPTDGEPHFMCAWCHGAAGVALGRLDSLHLLAGEDREAARRDAEIAVDTTLATGFGKSHCLCHGDLGNLEVLTLAAERLDRPDLRERRDRIAAAVLADLRQAGWRCGLTTRAEAPSLLVGVAGIGHGLLRLAAPERVPSVLTLAPPPAP